MFAATGISNPLLDNIILLEMFRGNDSKQVLLVIALGRPLVDHQNNPIHQCMSDLHHPNGVTSSVIPEDYVCWPFTHPGDG